MIRIPGEYRILELEQIATECLGEAAVYRELLETCYKAATQASDSGQVSYLHTVMQLHMFDVPSEGNARSWGKDFVYAYSRDAAWLAAAKSALERIITDVEKLLAEKDSPDDELKEILKTAEHGLIPHI